jgi:hypothetical protein
VIVTADGPTRWQFSAGKAYWNQPMPMFEIEQYELHVSKYRVAADNRAEAIAKLFAGEVDSVEQSQEFIEVADEYGLSAEEFPELVQELKNLGVKGIKGVIPSVRGVEEA